MAANFQIFFSTTFKIFILFQFNNILEHWTTQITLLALSKPFRSLILVQNIIPFYIILANQIYCLHIPPNVLVAQECVG